MPQLRSFKTLGAVAPVVISRQGCWLSDITGSIAITSGAYLQLFDNNIAPTNGDVPTWVFTIFTSATIQPLPSIFGSLGPFRFKTGLVAAISSTQDTYTAVATAYDIEGDLDEWEMPDDGTTNVGDLTTGLQTQQVWAEAAGGVKALMRLELVNQAGVVLYAAIFATDGMSLTTDVIIAPFTVPANSSRVVDFGTSGLRPFQLNTDDTQHYGCSIKVLDVLNPAHAYGVASMAMLSTYK